jgi:hypothetical protein
LWQKVPLGYKFNRNFSEFIMLFVFTLASVLAIPQNNPKPACQLDATIVKDVTFMNDQWVRGLKDLNTGRGDWISVVNGNDINMGLATSKTKTEINFKNYQINLSDGKLYSLPNKGVIDTIKSCSATLHPTWKNACSTGWNVNFIQYVGGSVVKDSTTGKWFVLDELNAIKTDLGKESSRDMWSVYFSNGCKLDVHEQIMEGGPCEAEQITGCSNRKIKVQQGGGKKP